MSIENLAVKGIYFSPDKGAGGQPPEPPADNTPEAADLLNRIESDDTDALMQIFNTDRALLVDDMLGKLTEFEQQKGQKATGEGK